MAVITTHIHHYLQCCCCKIDISNYMIRREIFKQIYYTGILCLSITYNYYYFKDVNLILNEIDLLLALMCLLGFSLILLYILNMIYLVFIILKYKEFVNTPQVVPIEQNDQNIQVAVVVNNN